MIQTWQALLGMLASAVLVAGGAVAVVKHLLRSDFVTVGQHQALERQVTSIKEQLHGLPNEHDVKALSDRMGGVETGVAVVRTTADGINAGLKRVERVVDQLLQRALEKDA